MIDWRTEIYSAEGLKTDLQCNRIPTLKTM